MDYKKEMDWLLPYLGEVENMYWAFWRKLLLFLPLFLPCNDHFLLCNGHFFAAFYTFMVRQCCRYKLAIFTNDTLPSLYSLHLRGFAFPLSSIYFHITRIPSYSYRKSIVKLLLVSWASKGPGPSPIDFIYFRVFNFESFRRVLTNLHMQFNL